MKRIAVLAAVCLWLPLTSFAQTQRSVADGYEDNIKGLQTIAALGNDLFGEQVNLKDGATSFRAVDVSVKTNSGLPVSVGRVLGINARDYDQYSDYVNDGELFGNWKLDVPYMHGVFSEATGWVSTMPDPQQRCSVSGVNAMTPPVLHSIFRPDLGSFTYYESQQYWAGNQINIPGVGEEPLLYLPADHARPSTGGPYYGTTRSNWQVSCLPAILNGTGEGFLVTLPDGTKYTFNWLSSRRTSALLDSICDGRAGGTGTCGQGVGMYRREYFLSATRVEDRFGNWVSYQYDASNPRRLLSVTSNDGASISLAYVGGKVSSITSNGRTWQYQYADESRTALTAVVQPDVSRWTYQYNNIIQVAHSDSGLLWRDCDPPTNDQLAPPPAGQILTVGHPSGAMGTFKFRKLVHGTDNTPGGCYDPDVDRFGDEQVTEVAMAYRIASLYEKSISGPGVAAQTWSYLYFPSWSWSGSYSVEPDCSAETSCNSTSETRVTSPDGHVTRYVFGNDYWTNSGQLLQVDVISNGVTVKSTVSRFLRSAAGQPFFERVGLDPVSRNNKSSTEKQRPQLSTTVVLDGVSGYSTVSAFDAFARPLNTAKSSSLGYAKNEGVEYYDNFPKWVLGQLQRTTINGAETAKADYDPATALPLRYYSFGNPVPVQSLTYNTDGTLATAADGKNQTTTLSLWKRGIPGSIRHADGSTDSAVIDDNGWVTSVTDENGYVTGYGYDVMGRLASVVPPEGNVTTRVFSAVGTAEHGLPAGHWRLVEDTGHAQKATYFDGFWRPVVQLAQDTTNSSGTLSWTATRYDLAGQVAFVSYPRNPYVEGWLNFDDASLKGTRTSYDALDRVTRVEQDSELGAPLVTTTEYLTGFQRRITNPRGFATTQRFEVYDTPNYDLPISIDAPLGSKTLITRDMFGKPMSVTRTGPDY